MKFVALLSGGKDSIYSAMEAVAQGHTLVCGANLAPAPETSDGGATFTPVETDSYMYQTAGHDAVAAMSECMGVPLIRGLVHGKPVAQGLNYRETAGDEVEDLVNLLVDVKAQFPEVRCPRARARTDTTANHAHARTCLSANARPRPHASIQTRAHAPRYAHAHSHMRSHLD